MNKVKRTASPNLLRRWRTLGAEWNVEYTANRQWTWKVDREELVSKLYPSTNKHCSFCDIDKCVIGNAATVEHFKPKSKFQSLSYKWDNLFLCCGECQKKGERFDTLLIKPDGSNYSFNAYFTIDLLTGKIDANPAATERKQGMAKKTIELYRLNYGERKKLRKQALNDYRKYVGDTISERDLKRYSYRFYIREALS